MRIYKNELGHMTKEATMPINDINLSKSSSPEPTAFEFDMYHQVPECTTKIVQMLTLDC